MIEQTFSKVPHDILCRIALSDFSSPKRALMGVASISHLACSSQSLYAHIDHNSLWEIICKNLAPQVPFFKGRPEGAQVQGKGNGEKTGPGIHDERSPPGEK